MKEEGRGGRTGVTGARLVPLNVFYVLGGKEGEGGQTPHGQ